jgi:hypothetical protein
MPGFLLHVGATVTCLHAGPAQPSVPNTRVMVMGMPSVTMAAPYLVTGCGLPAITSGAPPCVSATWVTAALRVTSNGQPLLLLDSQASCIPTGTPLLVLATQTRVTAM